MAERVRVALLFGGRSAEHEVSVLSAANVFRRSTRRATRPCRSALRVAGPGSSARFKTAHSPPPFPRAERAPLLFPAARGGSSSCRRKRGCRLTCRLRSTSSFRFLDGPFGEDGTVQGLAEIAGVAYVGSGVLGLAAAMDKDIAKRLMRDRGLPIPRFMSFTLSDAPTFEAIVSELGRPVFVKPARLGSSVGISKAGTREEFAQGVAERSGTTARSWSGFVARPRDRVRRARERGRDADRVGAGFR